MPLRDCEEVCANYIDDVLVYTKDWDSHMSALECVLQCLGKAGFTVKLHKCNFGKRHVRYLGHFIGCGRLAVPEDSGCH